MESLIHALIDLKQTAAKALYDALNRLMLLKNVRYHSTTGRID
jgi:hypothetical protein